MPGSELDIKFVDNEVGFVDTFIGQTPDRKIAECRIYRVAVTSRSTSPWTRLKVEKVTLSDGTTYGDLFLRIMHREPDKTQTQLHARVPQLWDVVQKAVGSEWVSLTHAEKNVPALLLHVPCQFTITASCVDGFPISKLVSLSLDKSKNNELLFKLGDVN